MSSRYDSCARLTYVSPGGISVSYLQSRILPSGASLSSGTFSRVEPGEENRLDLVAYRTLGNAQLGWRIADANDAMDPFELCAGSTVLRLPARTL